MQPINIKHLFCSPGVCEKYNIGFDNSQITDFTVFIFSYERSWVGEYDLKTFLAYYK